ncbi:MAG: FAD:protein FMN transferase [Hyphomicrobium sp.]|jgi:thiamine biosynthesis lipoprotein|nr:FAD:protein FMN transferase [Hyphomicrobium sp.]
MITWPSKPSRRQVLISGGLLGGALVAGGRMAATVPEHTPSALKLKSAQRNGIAFGTKVTLKAAHPDAQVLERALDAAWREIVAIENAASLFRPQSALSRLNAYGELADAPGPLLVMLEHARHISQLTDGAFDATVQPLWHLYANAFAQGRDVRDNELSAVRDVIGWQHVEVEGNRVRLGKPGMAITLNGLAQGHATERCLKALHEAGIENAFVDAGEIGIAGRRDDETAWTAAIADPRTPGSYLGLSQPAAGILATSGDYATVWSADYAQHHIIDPATLHSPPRTASVSVLAPSGALADGLATAMMVMGPEKSLALAAKLTGVEALIVTKSGERFATAHFPLM